MSSIEEEILVTVELCQRVLDGFGMPAEWAQSIINKCNI